MKAHHHHHHHQKPFIQLFYQCTRVYLQHQNTAGLPDFSEVRTFIRDPFAESEISNTSSFSFPAVTFACSRLFIKYFEKLGYLPIFFFVFSFFIFFFFCYYFIQLCVLILSICSQKNGLLEPSRSFHLSAESIKLLQTSVCCY